METLAETGSVWSAFAIFGAFVIAFPLVWCLVVVLLSRVGGWHRLGQKYAAGDRAIEGGSVSPSHVTVGSVRYRYVITLHLVDDGFFVDVMPLFRLGHPRLFIPYTEITSRRPARLSHSEHFGIGDPELTTITLPAGVINPPQVL